jgi:hypothetical protein
MPSLRRGATPLESVVEMTSGGARNRSGPAADPDSATSERRGLTYKLLPREGFTGRVPAYPLPKPTARERELWRVLWRTPQAAMWNVERWRLYTIGQYCRWSVRAEDPESPAAVLGQVHRLADQIGMTPAGMKENGWRVQQDEMAAKRSETSAPAATKAAKTPTTKAAPVRRLRAAATA